MPGDSIDAAWEPHYFVATLASLPRRGGASPKDAQRLSPTGESGAECPDKDTQHPRRCIVCETCQRDQHDSRILLCGQLDKRLGKSTVLDILFLSLILTACEAMLTYRSTCFSGPAAWAPVR
jgi:hypothetical protein